MLFGTLHMPRGQMPSKYGVDDPVPGTYLSHLVYPFKRRAPETPAPAQAEEQVSC